MVSLNARKKTATGAVRRRAETNRYANVRFAGQVYVFRFRRGRDR